MVFERCHGTSAKNNELISVFWILIEAGGARDVGKSGTNEDAFHHLWYRDGTPSLRTCRFETFDKLFYYVVSLQVFDCLPTNFRHIPFDFRGISTNFRSRSDDSRPIFDTCSSHFRAISTISGTPLRRTMTTLLFGLLLPDDRLP